MNDELSAWERSREATRRIMADAGCDDKGWPLPKQTSPPGDRYIEPGSWEAA